MVTATPPKTTRETWQDWLPDVEPTLTIDDVMERLQARGVDDVTVEHIRFWQKERILPAPIRRQVGTGKGGIRALYPPQAVDAIESIRPMQSAGVPLREINTHLARMFDLNILADLTVSDSTELKTTDSASAMFQPAHAHGEAPPITANVGSAPTTHTRTVPQSATVSVDEDPELLAAVKVAAKRQEQRTGSQIRRAEVIFTDTDGRKHLHLYPLPTE